MDDFIKAGKITAEAREYARSIIKENANIYEFVKKVEDKIRSLGAGLAFPVNVSINEKAAHDTADYNSEQIFESGQLVKVDLGAHINGFVGDTAFTVEISTKKYNDLIKASEEALKEALKIIRPGARLKDIGSAVYEKIHSYGFNPIYNLGGHSVGQYDLHQGLFIPNFDNGDNTKLEDGDMIAVEPFATTGEGRVGNTNTLKIMSFINRIPARFESAKKIQNYAEKTFKTLPFAEHHLYEAGFNRSEVVFGLRELISKGGVNPYNVLAEKSKGFVSQAEHTILVKDEPVITTL